MNYREWSIRKRMLLVAALPTLAAVLMLSLFHLSERWQGIHQNRDAMVSLLLENIAAAAEYPIISGNYELLSPLIHSVLQQPDIIAVTITNPEGEVLLQHLDQHYPQVNNDDIFLRQFAMQRTVQPYDEYAEYAEDIDEKNSTQLFAIIELSLTDTFTRQHELSIAWQSALVGLLVMFAGLSIAHLTAFNIVSSLRSLAFFFTGLAEGKFSRRLPVDNGAEIGQLQLNANSLAASLQRAEAEQQEFTDKLLSEQQKTQRANQAKSEFLAMMSHEFRTPLNGALGALQLMEGNNDIGAFADYKSMAENSLLHLSQLLEDVLVVVDVEKNTLPLSVAEHKLPDALAELTSSLAAAAMQRGLSLVVQYDEALKRTPVRTDVALIRQVVRHLVDNAIKFTNEGFVIVEVGLGEVDLNEVDAARLTVQVTDTGIGIPDHQKQSVLNAFAQVSSSFNREYEGMGLGLTITHHITTLLGGSLTLQDNPSGGTRVVAEFPVLLTPLSVASETQISRAFRVLVVEDNPVNLKVAEKMLQKSFQRVIVDSVCSGEACLEKMTAAEFDLVLMDCHMPGLDGFETTRSLRSAGHITPVIACTANTTEQIHQRCQHAGMNDFIAKPLKIDTLRTVLPRWL